MVSFLLLVTESLSMNTLEKSSVQLVSIIKIESCDIGGQAIHYTFLSEEKINVWEDDAPAAKTPDRKRLSESDGPRASDASTDTEAGEESGFTLCTCFSFYRWLCQH